MIKINLEKLFSNIDSLSLHNFKKYIPTIYNREYYTNLEEKYIKLLKNIIDTYEWEIPLATDYALYEKNGNRTVYEKIYFKNRLKLTALFILECYENDSNYIEEIINGIYIICSEASWIVPAHKSKVTFYPNVEDDFIDLFSAETGATLAWIYHVLDDKLPNEVRKIISTKVNERIVIPYENNDNFWWMWNKDIDVAKDINNWTTWINSNVLIVNIIFDKLKYETVEKMFNSINFLLSIYKDDGACNEGPTYYNHAVGSLLKILIFINYASDGKVDLLNNADIKNIAEYITGVHIKDNQFFCYADGCSKVELEADVIRLFSYYLNSQKLYDFSYEIESENIDLYELEVLPMNFMITLLMGINLDYNKFNKPKLEEVQKKIAFNETGVWLFKNSDKFTLAVKGGHNFESHNHNDVGSFAVYYNGVAILIDCGVGDYTKDTFNENRYTIFTMQSCYHNLPTINNVDQSQGKDFYAKVEEINMDKGFVSLDLSKAYNTNLKYTRQYYYKDVEIEIIDHVKCQHIVFHYMFSYEPIIEGNKITINTGAEVINLKFNYDFVSATTQKISCVGNEKLSKSWGDNIYRVSITPIVQEYYKTLITKER